jgi:hypothetical protein
MYRLRRTFATDGPTAVVSRKRGRPSNHRHGETFRRTVLALVHEHYSDFGPTLAAEKLAARHGLRVGVETLRQWMMSDGLWKDRRHRLPSPHQPRRRRDCLGTTAGKAPTPTNDDSQPRKLAPRLIRSLLASCLFAVALVHANGSFLLTAVLPGVPAVLAPHHPPGLGEGEQTVR